jgi:hypothetical protein
MPLQLKPTIFEVEIHDNKIKFAALPMRAMERLTAKESEAAVLPDQQERAAALVGVHHEVVLTALKLADNEVSADDLKDFDAPTLNTLFLAIMKAHGMTLASKMGEVEAKVGEANPR